MIQMHNQKTMLKKKKFANLLAMNHFQFLLLTHGLYFFFSIQLGGFGIPIVGIPCEPKWLCRTNVIQSNYFGKLIILFNL
jgi:hypothetical protein